VGWTAADRKNIPVVWNDFLRELDTSTNLLWRLEAHALALAAIDDDTRLGKAFTNLFEEILTNRSELVANPVEVISENWSEEALLKHQNGSGLYSEARDRLSRAYYGIYWPQLEAMNREYWDKTIPAFKTSSVFETQKKFIRNNPPYDFIAFQKMFKEKTYSQPQAEEMLALIIAYKSNLLANVDSMDRGKSFAGKPTPGTWKFFSSMIWNGWPIPVLPNSRLNQSCQRRQRRHPHLPRRRGPWNR